MSIERDPERTTLVWGHRTERPEATIWNIGPTYAGQTAAIWFSLRHAINYAVGMRTDREGQTCTLGYVRRRGTPIRRRRSR